MERGRRSVRLTSIGSSPLASSVVAGWMRTPLNTPSEVSLPRRVSTLPGSYSSPCLKGTRRCRKAVLTFSLPEKLTGPMRAIGPVVTVKVISASRVAWSITTSRLTDASA